MPVKRLLGYQLTANGYEPIPPNANGWLWLEPVKLWLGWDREDIACYDEAGNLKESYTDLMDARLKAEERVSQEAQARTAAEQRATAAEQRADQLEAELRRLRGDTNIE